MNIKNLQRAAEIATLLPQLKEARTALSNDGKVYVSANCKSIPLPPSLHYNFLSAINAEINTLEKEVSEL